MRQRILITGGCGLVGTGLRRAFADMDVEIVVLDLAASGAAQGDVRDAARIREAIRQCDGVIHLAAVSRVIWGERAPDLCQSTNVGGVRNVLRAAASSPRRPWVIFASSREVYGQPDRLPATETCPLRPVNIYGRTKIEGEALVDAARRDGVRACTIRLSNVFGSILDHADRVVPAFARGAAESETLRVDGAAHTFDFTHIDDVAAGITTLAALAREKGPLPPPIHFVTGIPTTLGQLATLAIDLAGSASTIRHAPPRRFDVARFFGSPARAKRLLGWSAEVPLETGLARLIADYQAHDAAGAA